MVLDTNGRVNLPASTGDYRAIGVLQNCPKQQDDAATVAIAGVSKVVIEGTTASVGDFIAASTDGRGIAPSTDAKYVSGVILEGSSGAAGRVASVLLGSWSTG
jgi:hypothetical protein